MDEAKDHLRYKDNYGGKASELVACGKSRHSCQIEQLNIENAITYDLQSVV